MELELKLTLLNHRIVLLRGTEILEPLICQLLLLRLEGVSSIRAILADAVVGVLGACHY